MSSTPSAHWVLLTAALWLAWRPAETDGLSAVLLSVVVLLLLPRAWQHSAARVVDRHLLAAVCLLLTVGAVTLGGADKARAVPELAVALAVVSLIWLASRDAPGEAMLTIFALGIAALAVWALWQLAFGFAHARQLLDSYPPELRGDMAIRLSLGRAFASQLLPGHLAILMAMALVLLLPDGRGARWQGLRWIGCALCVAGLLASRSLIGSGLAVCACGVLVLRRRRRSVLLAAAAVLVAGLLVVLSRTDLALLEPIALRLDNWHSALWVLSGSPFTGVGLGGFGQASQAVPFAVGNQPVHAHSLPLELMADLGFVGLGLLVFGACWLGRLVSAVFPRDPGLAVAVALLPIHNLVDFSCYVSGVVVPWAVLTGWALARVSRQDADDRHQAVAQESPSPHVVETSQWRWLAVTVAAVAVAMSLAQVTSVTVERAAADGDGTAESRMVEAHLAHQLAPWRIPPIELEAALALQSGAPEAVQQAVATLATGRWLRPRSASLASLQAQLEVRRDPALAAALTWDAADQAPADPRHQRQCTELLSSLESARDARSR